MNLTQMRESASVCLHDLTRSQLRSVNHYFDRRRLEARLASLVDAAAGHENQGLPAGNPLYRVLQREAELALGEYCRRWELSREQVVAEIPALTKLDRLAEPVPTAGRVNKVLLAVLALFVVSLLLGLAGACLRFGYLLGGGQ